LHVDPTCLRCHSPARAWSNSPSKTNTLPSPPPHPQNQPKNTAARAFEPFSENAAQVKRLINRDRKQFLGNEGDILDKFETEFGADGAEEAAASASASAAATTTAATATPAAAPAPPKPASPFGGSAAPPASPFGGASPASPASPFLASAPGAALNARSKIEPAGLSPTLGPDPLAPAAPAAQGGFLRRITLTQVVLFLSFSTIIGLMLATFRVAVNAGAIRLAGVE
jgi:hypothetical protein